MIIKIKESYRKLNIGIKASFWFALCNIIQKGIMMLSVPIFTRMLSTKEYGVYSVYQSWYSILTIVVTLYLYGGVYNKGMIKYEDERDYFTSTIQGFSCLVTLFCLAIYLLNIDFWTKIFELKPFHMLMMFGQMLFSPAYMYWAARQRFEYKYKALFGITCLIAILSPIIGIVLVLKVEERAEALIFSFAIVQIIVGFYFLCRNWNKGRKVYDSIVWKYALKFNLPLIPHYLSQIILNQADRIMISRIIGSGEAAIYSVAYNVSLIMSLFTNAINSAFVPSLYSCLKNHDYKKAKINGNYVIIIAALLTSVSMLFGPELIRIFAPPSYYEAKWIIPPVSMAVYFTVVYALFVNIEMYFEKTNYVMCASIVVAVLNIVLNWIFINQYGYLAAGYTTAVSYMLFSIGHYLIYRVINKKFLENNSVVDSEVILIISILLVAWMFIILILYLYFWIRWGVICTILLMAIWKRNLLIQFFKKVKTKKV